jgi:hypothetical protein
MTNQTYFAAAPPDEIVKRCEKKIDDYYSWLRDTGRTDLWKRVIRQYYAGHYEGGALGSSGAQSEFVKANANHFHNLGRHLVVMATSQRPSFEPKAVNSDHRSQTQTILASGILDYVLKSKGLEEKIETALETALLCSVGYLAIDWDATKGSEYGVDEAGTGKTKSGDLVYRSYGPLDVVVDVTKTADDAHQWRITRDWTNRFDLATRYPDLAEKILGLDTGDKTNTERPRTLAGEKFDRYESDDVEVWTLYHDRTDTLPDGRLVKFVLAGEGVLPLFDGPLPFDDLSLYPVTPEKMIGGATGYSPLYDLLSLQEAYNKCLSTQASNVAAFGVQMLWNKRGDDLTVTDFGPFTHLQSSEPPQALNLVANSPDTDRLMTLVEKAMETISGVNSVARGNPESSLKSGAALALVQAQAIQFSAGLQKATIHLEESAGTGTLRMYKRFAQAPQVAILAGKSNKGFLKEFTASDLDRIDRVTVEIGNPLARTIAGRVQMADTMLDRGLIKTVEQYMQVITSGRLDPVLEADTKQMLAIKSENEMMAEGKPAIVVLTDNHPAHIREHNGLIASPEARESPEVLQVALAHLQEHANQWRTMDPCWAMALGIPPPPPPLGMMPMGPPGMTPPPPPGEPTMSGPPPMAGDPSSTMAPPDAMGPQPNMPNMPTNPLTGERAPEPMPQ